MKWINRNKLTLIGGILGGISGFLYYQIIGCNTGTCPITSNPIHSSLYGIAMGGLLLSMFQPKKSKK